MRGIASSAITASAWLCTNYCKPASCKCKQPTDLTVTVQPSPRPQPQMSSVCRLVTTALDAHEYRLVSTAPDALVTACVVADRFARLRRDAIRVRHCRRECFYHCWIRIHWSEYCRSFVPVPPVGLCSMLICCVRSIADMLCVLLLMC